MSIHTEEKETKSNLLAIKLLKLVLRCFYEDHISQIIVNFLIKNNHGMKDVEISNQLKLSVSQVRSELAQLRNDGIIKGISKNLKNSEKNQNKNLYYYCDFDRFIIFLSYRIFKIKQSLDFKENNSERYQCVNDKCDFKNKNLDLIYVLQYCTNEKTKEFECELCKEKLKNFNDIITDSGSQRELLSRVNKFLLPITNLLSQTLNERQKENIKNAQKNKKRKQPEELEDENNNNGSLSKFEYKAVSTNHVNTSQNNSFYNDAKSEIKNDLVKHETQKNNQIDSDLEDLLFSNKSDSLVLEKNMSQQSIEKQEKVKLETFLTVNGKLFSISEIERDSLFDQMNEQEYKKYNQILSEMN